MLLSTVLVSRLDDMSSLCFQAEVGLQTCPLQVGRFDSLCADMGGQAPPFPSLQDGDHELPCEQTGCLMHGAGVSFLQCGH